MSSPVVTISAEGTVADAADLMLRHGISCLPVVDEGGKLVGILTHTDFGLHRKFVPSANKIYTLMGALASPSSLEQTAQDVRGRHVSDVMSRPVATVLVSAAVSEVAETMARRRIHQVPVMRGDTVVGVVSRRDLLKLMASPDSGPASGG
jgi:CBS domain-containing protein